MDRNYMDAPGNHAGGHNINDFELQDFTDDANFDQFIDLLRGETEDPVANLDCEDLINCCLVDNNQLFDPTSSGLFGFDKSIVSNISTNYSLLPTLPHFGIRDMNKGGEADHNDGEGSSETTTTTTTTMTTTMTTTATMRKRPKVDQSQTLVLEKKRRGKMKELLYALRSLVPNITKMDKASIVGDAVLYVQDMQKQAEKLKSEISGLQASLVGAEEYQGSSENPKKNKEAADKNNLVSKGIIQIELSQVEEKGFYVKVSCNKGEGVATALYKALESLTSLNVQSSNLNTVSDDRFEITIALNVIVKECEQDMIINLPNLKLWVTGAFLNQGFELEPTSFSP